MRSSLAAVHARCTHAAARLDLAEDALEGHPPLDLAIVDERVDVMVGGDVLRVAQEFGNLGE